MATPETSAGTGISNLTWAALGLAVAGVVLMVALAAADHDGGGWLLQPVLGLAAVAVAWRAGGRSPRNPLAFTALIVGLVLVALFIGFTIAEA